MDAEIQNNEGQNNVVEAVEEPKVEEPEKASTEVEETEETKTVEEIDETAVLGETTVDVVPIVEEPSSAQPIDVEESPINDPEEEALTESNLIEDSNLTKDTEMVLVPVKGNPKVLRCTGCNTFVSRERGHTVDECVQNKKRRDACRGKKRRCNTKKCMARKGKTLAKKYCKKRSKLPKEVKDFLERFLC